MTAPHGTSPKARGRRSLRALCIGAARAFRAGVLEFLRDRRGGAMLVAGIGAATIMVGAGAGLVNLAWHEAHREELRAAMRAAVASVGAPLLARAGDGGAVDQAIAERVGAFVEAASGAEVAEVTVGYDDGRIAVEIDGELDIDDLWGVGRMLLGGSFTETVAVTLDSTRHEFAVALDISRSMGSQFGTGTRLDGLKAALETVASNLEAAQRDSPAGMMVSVVPYASAVRVADIEGAGQTEDKARYLRMMGGRSHAKWVDVYHHYGVGGTHEIAVPAGWNWDRNRFTGCFMARWGAYWNTAARPSPMTWPAALNGEPLHLSDAPPRTANANTLFTPYSWPDSGPAGNIDARLQWAMARILAGSSGTANVPWFGDNDWSLPGGGGGALCPDDGVMPLTDDVARLRRKVADLGLVEPGPGGYAAPANYGQAATYGHLGIVWGMRMLSAGWRDVWNTRDFRGAPRPAPAAANLHKTILVVSDGANVPGRPRYRGQLVPRRFHGGRTLNPFPTSSRACKTSTHFDPPNPPGGDYVAAAAKNDAGFNASFAAGWRAGLANALGVPALASQLAGFEPVDAFRGVSAAFGDALVAAGLPRPTQVRRGLCDYTSYFSPYGRSGDPLYVGGAPVFDGSPWPATDWPADIGDTDWATKGLPEPYTKVPQENPNWGNMVKRLYEWWDAACALADTRGVTVHAVFIGDENNSTKGHIDSLRRCSASTGGEALVTPDAETLDDALGRLIRLQRTLRFVD